MIISLTPLSPLQHKGQECFTQIQFMLFAYDELIIFSSNYMPGLAVTLQSELQRDGIRINMPSDDVNDRQMMSFTSSTSTTYSDLHLLSYAASIVI